ncbi:uncharacterized protein LOC118437319 [Folsomia candida]|uniref:uncharacterized protein LOC118437319 n=1 Tax=Folsomia candida TaxID=158441 RepID=UPI001604DE3E|nr:uncharacterized protein LOC118437319 [Folsomia candida]
MFLQLLSFATCVYFTVGYVQEITFYPEPDYGGNATRFQSKEPDVTPYSELLRNVKSYCLQGYWEGYSGTDYTISNTLGFVSPDTTLLCWNRTFPLTMSLRFMGPMETETPSVSIYSGTTYSATGGNERTFTGLSANNFGFVPTFMVFTGRSSWTGFVNDDFSGNSICFSKSELIGYSFLQGWEIRSLVQGCNPKYKSEYWDVDKVLKT